MLIPCPCCGERDLREFTYLGDAQRDMPALDAGFDAWAAYVWERENPCGPHEEFWQHSFGCRHVLKLRRDTRTHAINGAAIVGPWADDRQSTP